MDAAMAMRARASGMHRAVERRMLACRLSTLVCGICASGSMSSGVRVYLPSQYICTLGTWRDTNHGHHCQSG